MGNGTAAAEHVRKGAEAGASFAETKGLRRSRVFEADQVKDG